MKRPSVRFSVRTMLVAVAVVGLASGGVIESGRRHERFLRAYREQALAEYECAIKAKLLVLNFGTKGGYHPSLSESASMWALDAEERKLLEANQEEDVHGMMRDAGWKNTRAIPLVINFNETMDAGGLGKLLRREEYHRRLRRKYQRAARYPWLPVAADSPPPG